MRIISVIFEQTVHRDKARFEVPVAVCDLLKLKTEDSINLVIRDRSGMPVFGGTKTLKSGWEIYGEDIDKCLKPEQEILVEAGAPSP